MIEFYRKNFDYLDTYNKFMSVIEYLSNNNSPLEIEKLDDFTSPSDLNEIVPLLHNLYKNHYAISEAVAVNFNLKNFTNHKLDNIEDIIISKNYLIHDRVIFFTNPLSIEAQNILFSIQDYDKHEILFDNIGIIIEEQLKEVSHKINKIISNKKVDLGGLSMEKIFNDLIKHSIIMKSSKLKIFVENNLVKANLFVDGYYLKNKEIILTELNNFNNFKSNLKALFKNDVLDWKYYSSFYKILYNVESDENNIYLEIHNLSEQIRDIKEISLKDKDLQILLNSMKSPSGVVIVSGNSDSGKRSVLYSLLNYVKTIKHGVNIVTFEKEKKNNVLEITQIETDYMSSEKASSYSIVGVDNKSTVENMKDIFNMASRGKFVIAVVESSSIFNTLNHLYDSVDNKEMITENLLSILHVGLLNKVCKSCSYESQFNKQKEYHFFVSIENCPKLTDIVKEENKEGCDDCNYGFLERVQVCELLENDAVMKDLFLKNYNINNYKIEKRSKSWNSIFENSMGLLANGKISLNSIIKSIGYFKK